MFTLPSFTPASPNPLSWFLEDRDSEEEKDDDKEEEEEEDEEKISFPEEEEEEGGALKSPRCDRRRRAW